MKSIVSIQDMTEELSSEKTMTNSEDVAETETSVLVPTPKQNDAKDEGQPMDIGGTKEDEVNQETPPGMESGTEEMTPTNGSLAGEETEDKSNGVTDENSNTDVNSNVEAAREEQNGTEGATSVDESKEILAVADLPDGKCSNVEIKDKIEANEPPGEKMEEATQESTTETVSESTNTNDDDTMGTDSTSGDGSDDFVNAIEEQLEKVVQEEEAKQPEDEPKDDRPESEKVVSFVMDALFGSAMEQVATKAVYDEALSSLNLIAQSNRRLLDEDLPGNFDTKF